MSSPLSCASPSSETPDLPAGVLGKRKGWDGSEMEMRRTEEELLLPREGPREGEGLLKDTFQNTVVGEGYQHRGVVRQRSGAQGVSIRRYDVAESQDKKQGEFVSYLVSRLVFGLCLFVGWVGSGRQAAHSFARSFVRLHIRFQKIVMEARVTTTNF